VSSRRLQQPLHPEQRQRPRRERRGTTTYPGPETLLLDFGYLDCTDGCSTVTGPQWFEGAETICGFHAVAFGELAIVASSKTWAARINPR
jgi:hypothetical protein